MTKKLTTKRANPATRTGLPNTFRPGFLSDLDGRLAIAKEIRRQIARFKTESGADTLAKETLCQRAAFLAAILGTIEVEAVEKGMSDAVLARYNSTLTALTTVLKLLGLDKAIEDVTDIQAYLAGKNGS